MKLPILYAWHTDIVFHVLTHMKVENASNLFNEAYVQAIRQEKERLGITENLISQIGDLTDYYVRHFERLAVINFIPFMTNSFDELIKTIISWGNFTAEDKRSFINDFVAILERERGFYKEYWYQKDKILEKRKARVEKNLNNRLALFKCLVEYYKQQQNKKVQILFSYSMGQNGRGSSIGDSLLAAIPFPINEKDEEDTFFMTLHELTHPCTDELVDKYISMKDGSHTLTENIVMIADYELIREIDPTLVDRYFKWICNKSENSTIQLDEQMFYNIFTIPTQIKDELKIRIQEIIKCMV